VFAILSREMALFYGAFAPFGAWRSRGFGLE